MKESKIVGKMIPVKWGAMGVQPSEVIKVENRPSFNLVRVQFEDLIGEFVVPRQLEPIEGFLSHASVESWEWEGLVKKEV